MSLIKNLYRFFSPKYQNAFLDYPVELKPRYGHGLPAHTQLYQLIDENRQIYENYLRRFFTYKQNFISIKRNDQQPDEYEPFWNNNFLPGLDIVSIYGFLAELKPKRYIEVGSGNSTKVAYKAIKDQQLPTKITSIDPFPRATIDKLSDEIIRMPFEKTDLSMLDVLEENDILFIDNSHRSLPNSDATVFFLEVLPRLRKGVIVHIHDIYIPYDYPQDMCDRLYNEQYLLACFILANHSRYKTILPNYFVSQDKELSKILADVWNNPQLSGVETHGGSYWLQIQ